MVILYHITNVKYIYRMIKSLVHICLSCVNCTLSLTLNIAVIALFLLFLYLSKIYFFYVHICSRFSLSEWVWGKLQFWILVVYSYCSIYPSHTRITFSITSTNMQCSSDKPRCYKNCNTFSNIILSLGNDNKDSMEILVSEYKNILWFLLLSFSLFFFFAPTQK